MAWAEEAAIPTFGGSDIEIFDRRATKVRAGALDNQVLALDRARLIRRVAGLLFNDLRVRVFQAVVVITEPLQHILRSAQHENELAAPQNTNHLAHFQRAQWNFNRRNKCLGARARLQ